MRDAVLAYVRRDWLVWSSYRFNAVLQFGGVCLLVLLVVTVGDAVDVGATDTLSGREDYIPFVLAGLAFSDVFFAGLTSPPKAVREGQVSGTLEPVLLAPVGPVRLVLGAASFGLLQAVLRSLVIVTATIAFLGHWRDANPLAVAAVVVPAWIGFVGLGLLSAAFTVVIKQGDPVAVGYAALSAMLGGTVVPVSSLPGWLQGIGGLLPLTHALGGIRTALEGGTVADVAGDAALLAVMALVFLPAGLVGVVRAFRYARQEGSLVHY